MVLVRLKELETDQQGCWESAGIIWFMSERLQRKTILLHSRKVIDYGVRCVAGRKATF